MIPIAIHMTIAMLVTTVEMQLTGPLNQNAQDKRDNMKPAQMIMNAKILCIVGMPQAMIENLIKQNVCQYTHKMREHCLAGQGQISL